MYRGVASPGSQIAPICKRLKRKPIFVSVGDMVDRGPDSYAVVEHFRSGVLAGTHAAVAGNHEALMLRTIFMSVRTFSTKRGSNCLLGRENEQFLYSRPAYQRWGSPDDWIRFNRLNWTSQGGGEALESYGCHAAKPDTWNIPSEHIAFLCGLPLLWQDATCVVTHALAQAIDIHQLKQGRKLDPVGQYHTLWSRSLPRERPDSIGFTYPAIPPCGGFKESAIWDLFEWTWALSAAEDWGLIVRDRSNRHSRIPRHLDERRIGNPQRCRCQRRIATICGLPNHNIQGVLTPRCARASHPFIWV